VSVGPEGEVAHHAVGFRELDALTDAAARVFRAAGIGPGTRTLLALRPGAQLITGFYGLLKAGAVPVLIVPFAAAWHRPSLIRTSRVPVSLATIGLALLIVGLARPQRVESRQEVRAEGYDLMLAIDLSGSMQAEDFERDGERINRLQTIKPVIQAFISDRPSDRIGIVVFSGRAYTLAPLTFDHAWLGRQVERLKIGLIEDGTAIGDGLGVALARLEQPARAAEGGRRLGAFVVLLTDGANNRGTLTPPQATEIARARNIPVYTIGAGRDGFVPFPVFDDKCNKIGYQRRPSDLDESALREVLEKLPKHAFIADLAAPPGGVDFEAAKALGLKAIWARGLGSRAPVTVGASQWSGVRPRIEKILRADA
jgi:hypothetical protein